MPYLRTVFKKKQPFSGTPFQIDETSFKQVYLTCWQKVFAICFNQTRNQELSKEMVQDIFKSLWERREQLRIEQSIEFYLMRAAKLKVCEYIRNKVTATRHMEVITVDYCDADYCTEKQIAFNELNQQVNTLVDTLSCQCRKAYRLSQIEGLSNKDVASALLISEKAVEYHLNKAKTLLRSNLLEYRD
jgi:RNA polymerase sigma-70 factor (family 1)